jgi:hypothetical protein
VVDFIFLFIFHSLDAGFQQRLHIQDYLRQKLVKMDMGNMPMGSTSAGNGIPSLFTFQRMYWAVVGTVIGIATLVNVLNYVIFRQR